MRHKKKEILRKKENQPVLKGVEEERGKTNMEA